MAFTKQNKRYERSGYFAARTPYEAAQALQRGGYATDPNYANSLAAVIKGRKIDPMRPVVIKPTGSIDDGTGFRGGISRDTQVKAQQSYAVARQAILNDNRLTAAQNNKELVKLTKQHSIILNIVIMVLRQIMVMILLVFLVQIH